MELLTEDEISARLDAVPGWVREGNNITTTVTRADFKDAMLFTGPWRTWPSRPITIRTS